MKLGALRRFAVTQVSRSGQLERVLHLRNRYRSGLDGCVRRYRLATAGRRLRRTAEADRRRFLTTTGAGGRSIRAVVAEPRTSPRVLDAMHANRDLVVSALAATGIGIHEVPLDSPNRFRVAVLHDHQQVLWSLLAAAPRTTYVYFDSHSIPHRRRLAHLATTPPKALKKLAAKATIWRVFTYQAHRRGTDVFGDIHGCEIELWEGSSTAATARSRRWNPLAVELPKDRFTIGGHDRSTVMPLIDTIEFPIDIVYTWVDGSDPAWLNRRAETLGLVGLGSRHDEAASDARYLSRDELMYSLRSVERFADFVNHVYIVTDDQCPSWLRTDHPGVTVVDHREIFPDDARLPTFNSHAIETRLHHVPGLSEHYIYLNDDFFFGGRVEPSQFFHGNGLARFFTSRALIPLGEASVDHKPVDAAAMNSRRIIANKFGKLPTRKFKHAPYPQLRSVQLDIEDLFPDDVSATTASQVRSPTDLALASSLHHHVAYLTGRAVAGSIATYYADLGQFNLEGRLSHLMRTRRYDTFCLNDTDRGEVPEAEKNRLVGAFLDQYFPDKSSYER